MELLGASAQTEQSKRSSSNMTTINLTVVVKEDLTLDEVIAIARHTCSGIEMEDQNVVEGYLTVDGKRVEI